MQRFSFKDNAIHITIILATWSIKVGMIILSIGQNNLVQLPSQWLTTPKSILDSA